MIDACAFMYQAFESCVRGLYSPPSTRSFRGSCAPCGISSYSVQIAESDLYMCSAVPTRQLNVRHAVAVPHAEARIADRDIMVCFDRLHVSWFYLKQLPFGIYVRTPNSKSVMP